MLAGAGAGGVAAAAASEFLAGLAGWRGWVLVEWSEQTFLGLVHLHACAAATLDGNTAALALHTLLPSLHSPLHFLAPWLQAASRPAGLRRRRGMCLGADRMRLGASEARIGVSCTGRALQRACSIFLQGLTGRGGSCWPPFAALRCWSLLVAGRSHRNAGGSEGVGKGALCSEFSVLCVLSYSTSTVADSPLQHHPVRSGLVRKAKFAQEQHLQPAWIGSWRSSLSGGCSRTIPTNLAGVCKCTRPTSPGNVYLASFQAYNEGVLLDCFSPPFCTHVQSSSCQRYSAGSVRQQAATPAQQGEQGTPFAGYAM
jgi:hypothetical protein